MGESAAEGAVVFLFRVSLTIDNIVNATYLFREVAFVLGALDLFFAASGPASFDVFLPVGFPVPLADRSIADPVSTGGIRSTLRRFAAVFP
jgi:hypothetical protein